MKNYTVITSPLGKITLQADNAGLCGLWFETQTTQPDELGERRNDHPILSAAIVQLEQYFRNERRTFDLPLSPQGTDFQRRVWLALRTIPYGQTWSYQQLAEAIGQPTAARAVGLANGRNPISVIVPCHRVVGKSGKLTGYAGGLDRKQQLLAHEQSHSDLFADL